MTGDSTPTRRRLDYAGVIERLRGQRGMTREALAEASGVSASYLSEVERGYKRPSTDVLAALAQALGMAPSELLALVEESTVAFEMPAAPQTARPNRRRLWTAATEVAEPPGAPPEAEPATEPKEPLIGRLVSLASTLTEDDLRILIDLARRLHGRGR